MSTAQWILNLALLGWVLTRNLGTHRVTRATFLVPLVVVAVAGAWVLRDLPTAGHDISLELIGIATGLVLGTLAALLTRMHRRHGHLVVSAGTAFAAVLDRHHRWPDAVRPVGHPHRRPHDRRVLDASPDHRRRRLDRRIRPDGADHGGRPARGYRVPGLGSAVPVRRAAEAGAA